MSLDCAFLVYSKTQRLCVFLIPRRMGASAHSRCLPEKAACEVARMKSVVIAAALAVAAVVASGTGVEAKGCVKGAIVGGIAGHFAGHHGLLGAGAGCAIGHHEAAKKAQAAHHNTTTGKGE